MLLHLDSSEVSKMNLKGILKKIGFIVLFLIGAIVSSFAIVISAQINTILCLFVVGATIAWIYFVTHRGGKKGDKK